jgi:RNA polymerase sigma-70 factor (ECF subfamily)
LTEPELLHKIKESPDAFSEVFKLYYKSIFGYILRRTGNFDDSADIAANTFFSAFTHINNFAYNGISIKVWLYRIATNEINQFFRHTQKHDSLFERFDFVKKEEFSNYLQQDKDELEAELRKHGQFLTILKALKKLPNKYQEVISLRYFEGKENKEIVEILNIKEGTLKSLLSRGLEKIRDKCNEI